MSRSWGHAVRHLAEAEIATCALHGWTCSTGKCREPVTHATQYSYITGRAGRASWSERKVCAKHAESFAAKHEVPVTDEPATEHASDTAIRQANETAVGYPRGGGEFHGEAADLPAARREVLRIAGLIADGKTTED